MSGSKTVLWFIVILIGEIQVYCQDEAGPDDPGASKTVDDEISALNYFTEYGYFERTGEVEEIIDEEKLKELMTKFQAKFGLNVTGILDDETKELMSTPRCGNPDFYPEGETRKKRFTRIGRRWPSSEVTWFITGYTLDRDLSNAQVHEQIRTAFQRWADVSALTLSQAPTPNNADILLSFQRRNHFDGSPFDGPGGTLAHAFPPPDRGLGGDVHFDDEETYRTDRGIILHQVATHEIGHSLGLGHSDDRNAVMAPFYRQGVSPAAFSLQSDDIAGIQAIYGRNVNVNPPVVPPIPTFTPPTTTTTTSAPTTTPTRTESTLYCNGQFDAATDGFDSDSVFLFQGRQVFKYNARYRIVPGYPKPISEEFPGVVGFIDAALTYVVKPNYRIIYLFKGDNYWRFDNGARINGYPRSITQYWGGVPANLDAAFVWTGNGLWYFVKGDQYYRYNILRRSIDAGYPRPLSVWRRVLSPIDAVTTFRGRTFFFQGQYYQVFYDRNFQASRPLQTAPAWLGCITQGLELYTTDLPTTLSMEEFTESSGPSIRIQFAVVILPLVIYLFHLH